MRIWDIDIWVVVTKPKKGKKDLWEHWADITDNADTIEKAIQAIPVPSP